MNCPFNSFLFIFSLSLGTLLNVTGKPTVEVAFNHASGLIYCVTRVSPHFCNSFRREESFKRNDCLSALAALANCVVTEQAATSQNVP